MCNVNWITKFGIILKNSIDLYGLDYEEFADELGVSTSNFRHWTAGRHFPQPTVLDGLREKLEFKLKEKSESRINSEMVKLIAEILPEYTTDEYIDDIGSFVTSKLMMCYAKHKVEPKSKRKSRKTALYPKKHRDNDKISSTDINNISPIGKIQVVVFDFDGTLTNLDFTKTTWEYIWVELGYSAEECRLLHKRFDKKEISHDEWCKLTEDKFRERHMHKSILESISQKIGLIDGCKDTFKELDDRNIKIHIVSGSILYVIQRILGGLVQYVDAIKANDFRFSNDGLLTKIIGTKYDFEGKASYISKIASEMHISSSDVLFIGNSYNDKWTYKSGAKTLCINPNLTDPSDTNVWHERIDKCTNLTQIFSVIDQHNNLTP